jgi:alkylation response protein AidB-like acyl-CoA dehydrogenase
MPAYQDLDIELTQEVITQAGRFARDVLAPINSAADLQGCHWSADTGHVTTPDGYVSAWKQFVEGGWPALACEVEFGGQDLPQSLNTAVFEMLVSANHAWTMYSGVLHGAYEALSKHGSDKLRALYLPKIVSGEWLATMALTEPQAGSDLSLLRSKATPVHAGTIANGDEMLVSGQKIFISGGDQDMTDNILHLVLARLPDAPAGTRGLSLILVPKVLADGTLNTAYCDGIEKKMGLKGSATCQMRFEQARGWLVGEPHSGLAAMFLMMNSARLHVGVQGLGHMEAARQKALAYAFDRQQMRAPVQPVSADKSASSDLIAWHPAIRHKLLGLGAHSQAARVVALWTASLLDQHEQHADDIQREKSGQLAALLIPIVKGFTTDIAFQGCDDALGVFGGFGYIHEYAIEQQLRDSRVARIYEGTNEIQAIDLVDRKLLGNKSGLPQLLAEFEHTADSCLTQARLASSDEVATLLQTAGDAVKNQQAQIQKAVAALTEAARHDPEAPIRVADDMLQAMGYAIFTWAWARIALATLDMPASPTRTEKRNLCQYGFEWLLPTSQWRWQRVSNWKASLPWAEPPA